MENQGLLFIPDISGFTRFVNQIEIEHSRNIIQELLESLINANDMGLTVSEVEGDAILFYKFGEMPNLERIYAQVEKMFFAFHQRLGAYDIRRYCQCKACVAAIDLSLKVITHYGEFTGYTVKDFNKLIGKDVIVAHQLLKNDLQQHEYWLVTNSILKDNPPGDLKSWMKWGQSTKQTEDGNILFHYTLLSDLKKEIPADPPLQLELHRKIKVSSVSRVLDGHIIKAFHATGDFNYRHLWKDGVKRIEELEHFLPRIGMRCRYVMDNEEVVVYASSYSFSPDYIEFSETDEAKKSAYYYILERIGSEQTRVTIGYYIHRNLWDWIVFRLIRSAAMKNSLERSLTGLEMVVKGMENVSDVE